VEHGVLAQKQLDSFVMLVKAHHYLAQFGLLFIQELLIRLHSHHQIPIFFYTSRHLWSHKLEEQALGVFNPKHPLQITDRQK
jgi:hypothetical protein